MDLKKTVLLLRHELFEADNKRIEVGKRLRECKEVYQSITQDKMFYIQKIKDQREAIGLFKRTHKVKDAKILSMVK